MCTGRERARNVGSFGRVVVAASRMAPPALCGEAETGHDASDTGIDPACRLEGADDVEVVLVGFVSDWYCDGANCVLPNGFGMFGPLAGTRDPKIKPSMPMTIRRTETAHHQNLVVGRP